MPKSSKSNKNPVEAAAEVVGNLTSGAIEKVKGVAQLPATRAQYKQLVYKNPNYFGNFPGLGLEPVELISGNTTYEELVCLGLNPEGNRLEAVVNIKQPYGYETGPCDGGSPEYVRFYVQRADGWHDLGVASFISYNMSGSNFPISYSVGIDLDEARSFCSIENIVNVRAILSWNHEPDPNNPDWPPTWGNVVNSEVQIAPFFFFKLSDLFKEQKLSAELVATVNLEQQLEVVKPQPLGYSQLSKLYAGKDVPGHRYGFVEMQKLLKGPITSATLTEGKPLFSAAAPITQAQTMTAMTMPGTSVSPVLSKVGNEVIGFDFADFFEDLFETDGDTTYEELACVGYNPQTGVMGAIINIKRNSGYSGSLCTPGSTEYVGFWAFYAGAWQPLGKAQVVVHDLAEMDADMVQYAVFRNVSLPDYACADVASIPLKAILSWQTEPTGPDFEPVWGNTILTNIQPPIGTPDGGEGHRLKLMRIGQVTTSVLGDPSKGISDVTGLANSTGIAGDCGADNSPFGGMIIIEGSFTNKLNVFDPNTGLVLAGSHPLVYQVFVNGVNPPTAPALLANGFTIGVWPQNLFTSVAIDQPVPVAPPPPLPGITGPYYTFMEGDNQPVNRHVMGVWYAGDPNIYPDGKYHIRIDGYAWNGVSYVLCDSQGKDVYIYNGYAHTEVGPDGNPTTVRAPQVALTVSGGTMCGDFIKGMEMSGTFSVTDSFYGSYSLYLLPAVIAGNATTQPTTSGIVISSGIYGPTGVTGNWTLDTTDLPTCGYVIVLDAWDRALVNDSCGGHWNRTSFGFCLRAME